MSNQKDKSSESETVQEKMIADESWSSSSQVQIVSGSKSAVGRRTVQETLAAYGTSPWFQAVVERVAYAAATVPWKLYAVRGRGRGAPKFVRDVQLQTCLDPESRTKLLDQAESNSRLVEITEHPLLEVLAMPNDYHSGLDMRLLTFATILVVGEIGWALGRDNNGQGKPISIWPIPPNWILRYPGGKGQSYQVRVGGSVYEFGTDEFVLFRNPSLANPYGPGTGIGTALSDELETDEYAAKFQNTFFHSRGKPDLVVTVNPGPAGQGPKQSELQVQKERFENEYRDSSKGGRSMWVRGDVKVTELSQKLVDLSISEQRTWIKDLIRETIGAPPEIMGDVKNSNRATVREALAILAMLSTVPQLERFRAQAQNRFVGLYDARLVLGYVSPVPADRAFHLDVLKTAPWAATRGEIRGMMGLEDRGPEDNGHLVPTGSELQPGPNRANRQRTVKTYAELLDGFQGKDISDSDVDRLVNLLQPERISLELTPGVEETIEAWGNKTLLAVGVRPAFDMLNPLTVAYLEEFSASKVTKINDTSKELVRKTLQEGIRAGEGGEALARRLRDEFSGWNRYRAKNIARTEVVGAANAGTWQAHKMSGVVDKRKWLATNDSRARGEHLELGARKDPVGIDEPFEINGYSAMYPGDFGDPKMDCLCRCTTYAVFDDPKSAEFEAKAIKDFMNEIERGETRLVLAVRRAFDWYRDLLLLGIARLG